MSYVLDTTAFSAAMRQEESMLRFLGRLKPGDVATVLRAVAEIEYGISRLEPRSKKRLLLESQRDRLLAAVRVLPWLPDSSSRFGAIKADLERRGEPIDDFDVAIAAIALTHGYGVVSANTAHFRRVTNLECAHWQVDA